MRKYVVRDTLDTDKLWDDLCEGAAKGHIMCCSLGPAVEYSQFITLYVKCKIDDLVDGHSYTILDVRDLEDDHKINPRIKGPN